VIDAAQCQVRSAECVKALRGVPKPRGGGVQFDTTPLLHHSARQNSTGRDEDENEAAGRARLCP
jgi:hypothetical protein